MGKKISHYRIALMLFVGLALANSAWSDDLDNLAEELIKLRGEVEELNQELDIIKDEHRAEMNSLAAQKTELEANRKRMETNIKQLQQKLDENRELATQAGVDNTELNPVLLNAIDVLQAHIRQGLPFRVEERIADLDEIKVQLETGVVPGNRAANRLWAFYEDEIRLTRENAIYSQTIELNGARLLADVAKLGTVMMFFKTDDERFGQVTGSPGNWRFEVTEDSENITAIRNLFDSLQKQIRQGFFELPNALAGRSFSS